MNDFENRLTQMLRERSTDIDESAVATNQIVRRARSRRTMTLSLAVAGFVALGSTGVALSMMQDGPTRKNIAPADATPYPGHPGPFDTTDDPSTKRIEVATGEHRGIPWTLHLYRDATRPSDPRPKDMWCDGFEWAGGGSGCPASISKEDFVLTGRQGGPGGNPEDSLTGRIDRSVARVVIRLDGYAPFEVPVIPGPQIEPPEEDPDVNFFVAFIPDDSTGEVSVFDSDGNELQTQRLFDIQRFMDLGKDFDVPTSIRTPGASPSA